MPGVVGRDDERPARCANRQRIADARLFGPARRRSSVVDREINLEKVALGVVVTGRVVARDGLWLGPRARAPVRKEKLHVVVESEAGEPIEVAAKRDAD